MSKLEVSVVIPTRNRPESLRRCLDSLAMQSFDFREVIVVDASDEPIHKNELSTPYPNLQIHLIQSQPSVCVQRNVGIREASGSHIFLCDDDIELSSHFVSRLVEFANDHPDCGAITSTLLEYDNGSFCETTSRPMTLSQLLWRFVFQLTVWADIEKVSSSGHVRSIMLRSLKSFYRSRGNTWTYAGWPLLTQISDEFYRTTIAGIGVSLIRKEWLINSPFDEILDPHGIGDNYGVAINFPCTTPICVLRTIAAQHHKEPTNRASMAVTYYRRILALHYFMSRSEKFSLFNRLTLLWSLVGNLIIQVSKLDSSRAFATCKAIAVISLQRNPYLVAAKSGSATPTVPHL